MFDAFADAMEAAYPGLLDRTQPWIYSIAGGAMIQMKLYFASLHEYIMIWGTPIGSEGHSGRHRVGFWDTILDGETWYYAEGEFERRIYRPGDRIYVGPGQACGMNFTDGVWAVEYARGRRALFHARLQDRGTDAQPVHGSDGAARRPAFRRGASAHRRAVAPGAPGDRSAAGAPHPAGDPPGQSVAPKHHHID
jgi:hypothetical protein